jgi:hypothetical protein
VATIDNIRLWLRSRNPDAPATRNGQPLALAHTSPVSEVAAGANPRLRVVPGIGPSVEPGKHTHDGVTPVVTPMARTRKRTRMCESCDLEPATVTVRLPGQSGKFRTCWRCSQPGPDAGHAALELLGVFGMVTAWLAILGLASSAGATLNGPAVVLAVIPAALAGRLMYRLAAHDTAVPQ